MSMTAPSTASEGPAGTSRPGRADTTRLPDPGRYLTFTLQGEMYALAIARITEIIEYRPLTVVPMMPACIRGVLNLRGRVLPVVDLGERFGRQATDINRRTSVIVVETTVRTAGEMTGGGTGSGILVDAVNKVVHLGDEDLRPAPAFGGGVRCDFVSGMARIDNQFVVVLDIDQVLALEDGALRNVDLYQEDGAAGAP